MPATKIVVIGVGSASFGPAILSDLLQCDCLRGSTIALCDINERGLELMAHLARRLNRLVNENFDLRRKIMNISDSNIELVETARQCGASAKFAGSGGSIIGLYEDDDMLNRLIIALRRIRARVIKPFVI